MTISDDVSDTSDTSTPPTFDVLPLSPEVRRAVDELGYTHPTPVQRAVYEPARRGQDLVVQARTGTGKTAAFGLPIIDVLVKRSVASVQAVVLCPTRELALQVTREFEVLAKYRSVRTVAVYGGAPMPRQVQQIRDGAQVLIGTPGRVLDHLRRGTLDFSVLACVVLDESDEMLSMGFLPQINEILDFAPERHQTLLFSATLPADIQRVAETRLDKPEFITLSGDQIGALEIEHFVYLSRGDKVAELVQVIETDNPESAVIFCNTRDETKRVAGALEQQGFAAAWLNADLAQSDREKVMAATRQGDLRFLVATDVAARGIDISHLTHVINYDFPESPELYIHRTGRTGRAGRTGTAISLIAPPDVGNLYMMRLTYKIRPIERQLPSRHDLKTRAETDLVDMFVELFGARAQHPDDLALARRLLTHERAEAAVAGLLREHLGARPDAADEATAARRSRSHAPAPGRSNARANGRPSRRARKSPSEAILMPDEAVESVSKEDTRGARRQEARVEPVSRTNSTLEEASPPVETTTEPAEVAPAEATVPAEPAAPAEDAAAPSGPSGTAGDLAEVYVNVGRKHGAKPSDFEALLEAGGVLHTDYVRVRDRHTFVGVKRDLVDRVIDALSGAVVAGRPAKAEPARQRS